MNPTRSRLTVNLRVLALLAAATVACAGAGPRPAAHATGAAVSGAPRDATSVAAAGEAALRRNEFSRAEALLGQAAKLAPGDARTGALLATAVFQQARFDEALALARASLEKGETYEARLVEGRVSAIRRSLDDTVRAYDRCAALQPNNPEAWSAVVAARLAVGDAAAAARAWDELARLEDPVKLPLKAEDRVWTDILRLPPDPYQFQEALDRCSRGSAAHVARRYDEAAYELQVVAASIPGYAHCWSELGRAQAKLGRTADAERSFRTALENYRPDQTGLRADTQALLARLLLDQGKDAAEALSLARAASEVRRERADVVATLALACEKARDPSCAAKPAEQKAPAAADLPARPPPGPRADASSPK